MCNAEIAVTEFDHHKNIFQKIQISFHLHELVLPCWKNKGVLFLNYGYQK